MRFLPLVILMIFTANLIHAQNWVSASIDETFEVYFPDTPIITNSGASKYMTYKGAESKMIFWKVDISEMTQTEFNIRSFEKIQTMYIKHVSSLTDKGIKVIDTSFINLKGLYALKGEFYFIVQGDTNYMEEQAFYANGNIYYMDYMPNSTQNLKSKLEKKTFFESLAIAGGYHESLQIGQHATKNDNLIKNSIYVIGALILGAIFFIGIKTFSRRNNRTAIA